jgi:hypothetical protein
MRIDAEAKGMNRFFERISAREPLFFILACASVAMFALMQFLFRTQFPGSPGAATRPALPDSLFFYRPEGLMAMLDSLGEAGRARYLLIDILDMAFPVLYGLFFAVLISRSWAWTDKAKRAAALFVTVPVIGGSADLIENFCVRSVISSYGTGGQAGPTAALRALAALVSGYATAVKWSASAFSLMLIPIGAAFSFFARRASRK